jgi:hypothetical protein
MDKVPAIFQVIGYPLYSQPEVGDYIVDFADSDHPGMPDLLHKPNHANEPITTAPGQQSPMYAMVAAKLLTNRTDPLTGCLVTYRLGTRTYRQRFDCQFQIGGDRLPGKTRAAPRLSTSISAPAKASPDTAAGARCDSDTLAVQALTDRSGIATLPRPAAGRMGRSLDHGRSSRRANA